uniref:RNase H type-1 domain-containing protein n=1 Tax=Cannabis sativa TaxID=3483 RepID=A0A803PFP6_CANSA
MDFGPVFSVFENELNGIALALHMARNKGIDHVRIESDSMAVVHAFKSENSIADSLACWARVANVKNSDLEVTRESERRRELSFKPRKSYDYLLMTDASWKDGVVGIAVIMIQPATGLWASNSAHITAVSALDAEIQAMLCALNWAKNEGWENLAVISDALLAVEAFDVRKCPSDWKCYHSSFLVLDGLFSFQCCNFYFVPRKFLVCVDLLAKSARISSLSASIVQGEGIPHVIPMFFS